VCRVSPQQRFHLALCTGCQLEVSTAVKHTFLVTALLFTTSMLASIPLSTPPSAYPSPFLMLFANLPAEPCFCQPFVLVARWQLAVVSWTHVDPRYRICRYRLTPTSVVGINVFVSRLLFSVRFVGGGDEGKSPSTDSSVPTIVHTSTAVAAIG
jgi:hypothetical protein